MSERLKTPWKCAIFDDGNDKRTLNTLDASIDDFFIQAKKGKDVSSHEGNLFNIIAQSDLNRLINRKILSITVVDNFIGYDSAVIVIDNKDSDFTNKLFDGAYMRTISDPNTLALYKDRKGAKAMLLEGMLVSIYGGYYNGGKDLSRIKRQFQGMIANLVFAYPENGTPTITMQLMDRFSWMRTPRTTQGSSLTMYGATFTEAEHPENFAVKNDIAYMSYQNKINLALEMGTKLPPKPKGSATGRPVGENLTTDTAKKDAQLYRAAPKKPPAIKVKQYRNSPESSEDVGLRDSQVVALVVHTYNQAIEDSINNIYGAKESQAAIDSIVDGLRIKQCFIAMTGEGGPTYADSSCFSQRVRGNKNAQPVSVTFYDYLQQLAAKHNFDVFVIDQTLFFIPPLIKKIPDFTFLYGPKTREYADKYPDIYSMISFTPQINFVKTGVDFWFMDYDEYTGMARILMTNNEDRGTVNPDFKKRTVAITSGSDQEGKLHSYGDKAEFAAIGKKIGVEFLTNERFPSAAETIATALAQAESDIMEAEISIEGDPEFYAGATIRCVGLSGRPSEKYKAYRFDGNYRVNEVTHEWSTRGYECKIKAVSRAIQGITFVEGDTDRTESEIVSRQREIKPASWDDFAGLWKKDFLLEPSLIWNSSKHIDELSSVFGTSDKVQDPKKEIDALKNGISPEILNRESIKKIATLGLHTYFYDKERFQIVANKCPMLTFAEAAQLLYGNPLPITGIAMDTNRTEETRNT